MLEPNEKALLKEYVERDSEEVFDSLVHRHFNKVYSIALRHTSNPHQAEEITQSVLVVLGRRAATIQRRTQNCSFAVSMVRWPFCNYGA
jgi:DNA-directed RNA polymerase specialized sigma24 family protein